MEFCVCVCVFFFLQMKRRKVMEFSELQIHKQPGTEIIKDEHVITFLEEKN